MMKWVLGNIFFLQKNCKDVGISIEHLNDKYVVVDNRFEERVVIESTSSLPLAKKIALKFAVEKDLI
jgi:hypothetical protein